MCRQQPAVRGNADSRCAHSGAMRRTDKSAAIVDSPGGTRSDTRSDDRAAHLKPPRDDPG
jgi:hypothetical protein